MKPRRVVITLEVTTDIPLALLRDPTRYTVAVVPETALWIDQVQVNVIRTRTEQ